MGQLQQVRDLACYRQKHAFLKAKVDALTLNVTTAFGERDFREVMKVKSHRVRF